MGYQSTLALAGILTPQIRRGKPPDELSLDIIDDLVLQRQHP